MQKQDVFGVLQYATQLLPKLRTDVDNHQFGSEPMVDEIREEVTKLSTHYKSIEADFIGFIRNKAKSITCINDMLMLFRDSSFAFGGLGARLDILVHQVIGDKPRTKQDRYDRAIRKNSMFPNAEQLFDSLPGTPICGIDAHFDLDSTLTNLAEEAFTGERCYENDARAMASVLLLNYLDNINSQSDNITVIEKALCDAKYTKLITTPMWANRPLVGYFATPTKVWVRGECINADYKIKLNKEFVRVFVDKLMGLVSTSRACDADFFNVQLIRQLLYRMAVEVYFGPGSNPLIEYDLVSRMAELKKNGALSSEVMRGAYAMYPSDKIITRKTSLHGEEYDLNVSGLQSFCTMIDALGLDDMPGFAVIAAVIQSAA